MNMCMSMCMDMCLNMQMSMRRNMCEHGVCRSRGQEGNTGLWGAMEICMSVPSWCLRLVTLVLLGLETLQEHAMSFCSKQFVVLHS